MTRGLPHAKEAILDIRKIEDYCLNSLHPRGRHKARVFRDRRGRMGLALAPRCAPQATREDCCGKANLAGARRRTRPQIRHMLGALMKATKRSKTGTATLLDVVALLKNLPAHSLVRGQVGTVVERLDDETLMVEFSDDKGRGYAIEPCARTDLLVLHYVPEAA